MTKTRLMLVAGVPYGLGMGAYFTREAGAFGWVLGLVAGAIFGPLFVFLTGRLKKNVADG